MRARARRAVNAEQNCLQFARRSLILCTVLLREKLSKVCLDQAGIRIICRRCICFIISQENPISWLGECLTLDSS